MQTIFRAFLVCAVFMLPLTALAKDAGKKKEKKGKAITVTGVLGDKAEGSAENVLAQLSDIKAGKKVKDAPAGPVSLVCSDEAVTTQIKDLLAKKAKVSVTGTVSGTTMTVTAISEQKGKGGEGKKKKKKEQ